LNGFLGDKLSRKDRVVFGGPLPDGQSTKLLVFCKANTVLQPFTESSSLSAVCR
jgi:hypothetical protein